MNRLAVQFILISFLILNRCRADNSKEAALDKLLTDVTKLMGFKFTHDLGQPEAGIGIALGDLNNDSDLILICLSLTCKIKVTLYTNMPESSVFKTAPYNCLLFTRIIAPATATLSSNAPGSFWPG